MTDDHARLLTQAARAALDPLGLSRKGRSRTWLDDQGWWLGIVEFQPSGFARGAYLNVGLMFLWRPIDHHVFEIGGRVEEFSDATDPGFAAAARAKADRAAQEVTSLRQRFGSLAAVVNYYTAMPGLDLYGRAHLGTALGLRGDLPGCREHLDHALRDCHDVPPDWPIRQWLPQARAAAEDPTAFRHWADGATRYTREVLHLPGSPAALPET